MSSERMTTREYHAVQAKPKRRTIAAAVAHRVAIAEPQKALNKPEGGHGGKTMRLTLPLPPSANRYWRNYRGVMVVSDEARAYKAGIRESAIEQGAFVLTGPVAVKVNVYRSRKSGDLDNRLKVCLDSLKGLAFVDDAQVVEIHAYRFDDKNNGRIEVEIMGAE